MTSWLYQNEGLSSVILVLYYSILGILAIFGTHRLVLVWAHLRTRHQKPPETPEPEVWPRVTVQLPIFNEKYVAGRLIDSVCRLDYPRERLEIQVLDDSTDETREIAAAAVERYRQLGIDIHHVHRGDRTGFKAGALAAGLEVAKGELVAVFDADFVVTEDYLRRTVPYFADPGIGMVQARWGHINREFSLLTRVQSILLDGHFIVEHGARHRSGCFFNFNGTAGIWRREAIDEAGGWEHDTLTEDLDLSYRAQLAGWKFLYLPDVVVPAELPIDLQAFKSQQHRWAMGSVQTGRKMLWKILRAPLPWRTKLESFIHLTNNLSYLLMLTLSILLFPAMILRRGTDVWQLVAFDLPLFTAATVSVLVFYIASQVTGEPGWQRRLKQLPALMGLGIGLAVNNTRAVVSGLMKRGGVFHRTPKHRIEGKSAAAGSQALKDVSYRLSKNLSFFIEGFLAFYFLFCFLAAIRMGMWMSLPFLYLFLQGYMYMFVLGIVRPGQGKLEVAPSPSSG